MSRRRRACLRRSASFCEPPSTMTLRPRYHFLRSLPSSRNTSPLSKPGSVAGFEWKWQFHKTLSAVVPSMLLQPLVENAVRHGVAPVIEGGTIAIESMIHNDCLMMTIRNSGPGGNGISAQNDKPSKGIGLTNTAERLRTLYGDNQHFSLRSPDAGGYEVTIELPFRREASSVEGGVCAL